MIKKGYKDRHKDRQKDTKTQGHKDTGTQRHRDKKTQGHKETGTQRHRRDTKTQEGEITHIHFRWIKGELADLKRTL